MLIKYLSQQLFPHSSVANFAGPVSLYGKVKSSTVTKPLAHVDGLLVDALPESNSDNAMETKNSTYISLNGDSTPNKSVKAELSQPDIGQRVVKDFESPSPRSSPEKPVRDSEFIAFEPLSSQDRAISPERSVRSHVVLSLAEVGG